MSVELTRDDLRAAVQAGYLTEVQAAQVQALAAHRLVNQPATDDEPFELFTGFSEIFISVGLVILISGLIGFSALLGDPMIISLFGIALSMGLAWYFTIRRRMVLPSTVLVCAYALSVLAVLLQLAARNLESLDQLRVVHISLTGVLLVALVLWYFIYRLPFTMFLIGLAALFLAFAVLAPEGLASRNLTDALDILGGSGIGLATLIVGVIAAVVALRFDMRDPYRLGISSASGFWLTLVAAPAIVNSLGQTAMALEGGPRMTAMFIILAAMTVYALVIDRRSFLTAGLGYLAWLIWALAHQNGKGLDWPVILILIGGAVTALGAWWVPLRGALMRALPEFPGKSRLPPYAKGDL